MTLKLPPAPVLLLLLVGAIWWTHARAQQRAQP
jgi:hypothetical protein